LDKPALNAAACYVEVPAAHWHKYTDLEPAILEAEPMPASASVPVGVPAWPQLAPPKAPPPKELEAVNHPPHYNFGKLEVIDVLEDWQLGFHEANAIKYIARARHKGNELQDLEKAAWYINRRIAQLKAAQ
jgi:hypothetical protein